MSFLEDQARKALEKAAEKSPAWIEKVIAEGKLALPQGDDPEEKAIRQTGEYGFHWLESNKSQVTHLGYDGLVAWVGNVALRRDRAAALVYMRQQATWSELDAALRGAADKTEAAKRELDAAIKLGKELGSTAARVLFPVLLALAKSAIPVPM